MVKKIRTKTIRKNKRNDKGKTKRRNRVIIKENTTPLPSFGYNKQFNDMVKLQCSPGSHKKDYTCLSDNAMMRLKHLWNIRHPDRKIVVDDNKEIWRTMKENMKHVCNKESCWLKQQFVDGQLNDELENSYAPESPDEWKENPNEWLSSVDIMNVMKQYEKAYKCFNFIGPSPIDFDTYNMYGECVWEELCHFDLQNEVASGKNKIGVIFNLDPHTKGGSHWVSLFINCKNKRIFYFDSAGEKIPKQIMRFVDRVVEQGNKLKTPISFSFDQNYPVEHQYGNTECGVYSLYFIVNMLEDKITNQYLKTHVLKDKYIEQFRKIYFNHHDV